MTNNSQKCSLSRNMSDVLQINSGVYTANKYHMKYFKYVSHAKSHIHSTLV